MKVSDLEKVSTGKVDIKQNHDIATLHRGDEENVYAEEVIQYACDEGVRNGWKIAKNMKQAMIDRAEGRKSLAIRECDILCRRRIDLSSDFFAVSIMTEGFAVIEHHDFDQKDNNIFLVRESYNKGLTWRKTRRDKVPEEVQEKGDARIDALLVKMEEFGLPAFPSEIKNGFPTELLKPEWMNWEQWEKSKRNPRFVTELIYVEASDASNGK